MSNEDQPDAPEAGQPIQRSFENNCILLRLEQLLPGKALSKSIKASKKYKQIAASIGEVGLVEPPVVARNPHAPGSFFILDGHLRISVLKEMGRTEVECLVSTDVEAFTYNKQINRLASVQEHEMIMNALNYGVPEERIAKVLSVNVGTIRRRSRMLNGVCREATDLLKDKNCPRTIFEILKKMQPLRQIEAAGMMINANNYSITFATALLAGTPQVQLTEPDKPKAVKGMTADAVARMEKELSRLQQDSAAVQETYGKDHLELTVVKTYLARLLSNSRIVGYLQLNRPEYLPEFQNIVDLSATSPAD